MTSPKTDSFEEYWKENPGLSPFVKIKARAAYKAGQVEAEKTIKSLGKGLGNVNKLLTKTYTEIEILTKALEEKEKIIAKFIYDEGDK